MTSRSTSVCVAGMLDGGSTGQVNAKRIVAGGGVDDLDIEKAIRLFAWFGSKFSPPEIEGCSRDIVGRAELSDGPSGVGLL